MGKQKAPLPPHTHKGIVCIVSGIGRNSLKYDAKGRSCKEKSQHQANKNVNAVSRNTIKKMKEQRGLGGWEAKPLPGTLHI